MMGKTVRARRAAALVAATALTIGFAACGDTGGESSAAGAGGGGGGDGPIRVGISNPMSGPGGVYAPLGKGMKAYLEYQNDQGGIDGRKIEVEMLDSAQSASGGATSVRNLLNKEPFLLGIVGSAPFQAATSVLRAQAPDVPVFAIGNAAVVAQAKLPSAYGEYPNYTQECFFDAQYAIEQLKATKIAVVYQDDAVGQGAGKECPDFARGAGASSATAIALPPTTTDYGSIAAKVRSSGADVAMVYALAGNVAGLQKAASSQGYDGEWITFSSNFDESYLKLAGAAGEGTYVDSWLEPIDADTPAAKLFRDEIGKRATNSDSTLGAAGWTMGAVAVHAMNKVAEGGSELTQKSFTDALKQIDGESIALAPDVSYAGGDQSTFVRSLAMYRVKDGALEKVSDPAPIPTP
jgi:branched-chain amino acid transport system substrate-binding protein